MGGHCRTGLEDNVRWDQRPPGGVERRARGPRRESLRGATGGAVATPAQARADYVMPASGRSEAPPLATSGDTSVWRPVVAIGTSRASEIRARRASRSPASPLARETRPTSGSDRAAPARRCARRIDPRAATPARRRAAWRSSGACARTGSCADRSDVEQAEYECQRELAFGHADAATQRPRRRHERCPARKRPPSRATPPRTSQAHAEREAAGRTNSSTTRVWSPRRWGAGTWPRTTTPRARPWARSARGGIASARQSRPPAGQARSGHEPRRAASRSDASAGSAVGSGGALVPVEHASMPARRSPGRRARSKKRQPSKRQRATAHGATTQHEQAGRGLAAATAATRARGRRVLSSTPPMMTSGIRMPMPFTMKTRPTIAPSQARRHGWSRAAHNVTTVEQHQQREERVRSCPSGPSARRGSRSRWPRTRPATTTDRRGRRRAIPTTAAAATVSQAANASPAGAA